MNGIAYIEKKQLLFELDKLYKSCDSDESKGITQKKALNIIRKKIYDIENKDFLNKFLNKEDFLNELQKTYETLDLRVPKERHVGEIIKDVQKIIYTMPVIEQQRVEEKMGVSKRKAVYRREADKKWAENNREHRRYLSARTTARSFIRTKATAEDLEELKRLIAERESNVNDSDL